MVKLVHGSKYLLLRVEHFPTAQILLPGIQKKSERFVRVNDRGQYGNTVCSINSNF